MRIGINRPNYGALGTGETTGIDMTVAAQPACG
jgi:hypothetical protein